MIDQDVPTHLGRIMASVAQRVVERKAEVSLGELERRAAHHTPRGLLRSLRAVGQQCPAVIAELKRASPSRGLLREVFHPTQIARSYEQAGAAGISVLTEEKFFAGSLDHLAEVSQAVSTPLLRKDFMVDPFQVVEARAAGADAILLIVAGLTDPVLMQLQAEAVRLELDVLCEVHTRAELERAAGLGFELIGVNSRNLKTLAVDPAVHEELLPWLPGSALAVAESGIRTPDDVERLRRAGYGAFLVGETLMRHDDPGQALAELTGTAQ